MAAVLVTAQLPAFARPGQAMDVNVSSLGNAKSLKGGTLITIEAAAKAAAEKAAAESAAATEAPADAPADAGEAPSE